MWLFVPPKDMTTFAESAFAPVSADWISECTWLTPDIELCAMSSETVSPRPLSWRGWQTRPWARLLSGTISDPLTADRGAAAFISSLPVIPASPSPCQGSEKARKTPVTSGPMSPVSSARSAPNGAFLRMSSAISPLVSETSFQTFSEWATELLRASNLRLKSVRRTGATDSSYWPTPTYKGSGNRACLSVGPEGLRFRSDLNQVGKQVGIKNAASAWTMFWDILIASGWIPAPFPSSHRVRASFGCGEKHSTDGLALNPAFTDLMMGWPMGWTDPLQPVTGWSRWLRQGRSQH